jgi:hypothetical protein
MAAGGNAIAAFFPVVQVQCTAGDAPASVIAVLDRTSSIDILHLILEASASGANGNRVSALRNGHCCLSIRWRDRMYLIHVPLKSRAGSVVPEYIVVFA